jgi:hypothetical protein
MNWKQPLILFLILAALGAWYFYYEIHEPQRKQFLLTESSRFLPGTTADDLQRISVRRIPMIPYTAEVPDELGYHIDIVRIDGDWMLVEPVRSQCDQTIVNAVGNRFAQLKHVRMLVESPDTLATFGLDNPSFILTLNTDSERVVCFFGDRNPSGDAYYVMLEEKNAVYLVADDIHDDLILMARDYRNRSIVDGTRQDISDLTLTFARENKKLIFTRDEDRQWYVSNGHMSYADQTRVEELLGALTNQYIQNFVDDPGAMERYGLDKPLVQIQATINSQRYLLEIGDYADAGGKMRYAIRNESPPVLMFNREFFELFQPSFFHYRSGNICRMDRHIVNKIEIDTEEYLITLVRTDAAGWLMQTPSVPATDSTAVGSFLSSLTHLKATGLKPDDAPFGKPTSFIRLYDDVSAELPFVTLTLGGSPEDGVGRWIKNSDENVVFRMSKTDIERIFPNPDFFTCEQ